MSIERKFRFWMPIDHIEKGKNKDGKEVMYLDGIASTKRKDMDDETLDPAGFDISYLMERGVVNYNHRKEPEYIVGEPVNAKFVDGALKVKTMLYPDRKLSKDIYDLAETLKKHGTRRLGYSIEGKATQRDPNDPLSVEKAMITGLAITINPKNCDSIVDIAKGMFTDVKDDEPIIPEFDMLAANGGRTYIIDIVRPDGMRVTVNSNYEIKIEKCLDTITGKAVIKEDLDGKVKDIVSKDADDEEQSDEDEMTKGFESGLDKILNVFDGVIDIEKATQINSFLIKNKVKMENVTSDQLNKALVLLGVKADNTLEKSVTIDIEKGDAKGAKKIEDGKFEDKRGGDEENITVTGKDGKLEKGKDDDKEEKNGMKAGKKAAKDGDDEEGDNLKKSITATSLQPDASLGAVGILLKSLHEKMDLQGKELSDIKKENGELRKSIDEMGDAPANTRKSVTNTKAVEKEFNKGIDDELEGNDDLRKGLENGTILSVSKQKNRVLDLLDKAAFEKGFDPEYGNALTLFESGGILEAGVVKRIKTERGISIIS